MVVNIRFVGSLRSFASRDKIVLDFATTVSLKDVVKTIAKELPALRSVFSDLRSKGSKANMLVLVNGKEISILNDWDTTIGDGDEVVFVPVLHGG